MLPVNSALRLPRSPASAARPRVVQRLEKGLCAPRSRWQACLVAAVTLAGALAAQVDPYAALPRHHIRPSDLPEPYHSRSVVNPPKVVPQPKGALVNVPAGFSARVVAEGFSTPRGMALAPNGDLFLTESSGDRLTVLRDEDGDGLFEHRWVFSSRLDRPFGIAFIDQWVYVGNTGSVVRFAYEPGQTKASQRPEKILDLPTGGHWTRNLLHQARENKLYISVGSRRNVAEEEPQRAAILRCNPDGSDVEIFASGLRNPVGLAWEPRSGTVWTCVNERDGLGDDLVPDYATHVEEGAFYGWPYSYIGANLMPGFTQPRPGLVERAVVPDVLFQAHSAALGMAFYTAAQFPEHFHGGAFVAFHGSWNRKQRTGYKVVYLPFDEQGQALGYYEDFMTGWEDTPSSKTVWGRPVGVLVGRDGSLLITDDGNDKLWRVSYTGAGSQDD